MRSRVGSKVAKLTASTKRYSIPAAESANYVRRYSTGRPSSTTFFARLYTFHFD